MQMRQLVGIAALALGCEGLMAPEETPEASLGPCYPLIIVDTVYFTTSTVIPGGDLSPAEAIAAGQFVVDTIPIQAFVQICPP